MIFSSINKHICRISSYFILLIINYYVQNHSTAALPTQNVVSLYNANDKITILTNKNFSSTVYQSETAWLIEFYASWCGHCQSYANTYREVGIDILGWKTVVRIGAINCYADENGGTCEENNIMAYPTLRLIPPGATINTPKSITLRATDAKSVERELIKQLDALHRTDKTWPRFTAVNRIPFEDLYARVPSTVKVIFLIVEKRDDFTGRQIMLDFSKYYEQIAIFRATTDGGLWHKYPVNVTDVPELFLIHSNRTIEKVNIRQSTNENVGKRNLFNYAIRSYIHQTKLIEDFDDHDLEEMVFSKNVLKNVRALKQSNLNNENTIDENEKNNIPQKITIMDLEIALSYLLRREVPRIKEIQGETYDALIHWLTVLATHFPGREPVKRYLKDLLYRVKEQPNGVSGKQFRELVNVNTTDSYLPNNQAQYQYCAGSSPHFRGYPCALWTLFHVLTVSQVESDGRNLMEIPSAIKYFIKYFFGCRHCSENFMKETSDINKLDSNDKYAAVVYFWKVHNSVNKRLHDDVTEDPKHPKIQFPSKYLCPDCHKNNDNEFDLSNTIKFLLKYYSKSNIDYSITEVSFKNQYQQSDDLKQYSMIEINNETTQQNGFIHFVTSIIHHFSFYFLLCFVIIILIFVRRKYAKAKRKRYTL